MLLGLFVVIAVLGVIAAIGRRRRDRAAKAARQLSASDAAGVPRRRWRASRAGDAAHYACAVPAPVCLIVNPAAGGGKARRVARRSSRRCAGTG